MNSDTPIAFKLNEIFAKNSRLDLIVWNRSNILNNQNGLQLIHKLLYDKKYKQLVLPMLRPLGRKLESYKNILCHDSHGNFGREGSDFKYFDSEHTNLCELWIQVAPELEQDVWDELNQWLKANKLGMIFRWIKNPLWEPLGSALNKSSYYPKIIKETIDDDPPVEILNYVSELQAAWFLKLCWARASEEIADYFVKDSIFNYIDPQRSKSEIKKLLTIILEDINLEDYGINSSNPHISPYRFGISHMAAFSINAITLGDNYFFENFCKDRNHASHPHHYASMKEYLSEL